MKKRVLVFGILGIIFILVIVVGSLIITINNKNNNSSIVGVEGSNNDISDTGEDGDDDANSENQESDEKENNLDSSENHNESKKDTNADTVANNTAHEAPNTNQTIGSNNSSVNSQPDSSISQNKTSDKSIIPDCDLHTIDGYYLNDDYFEYENPELYYVSYPQQMECNITVSSGYKTIAIHTLLTPETVIIARPLGIVDYLKDDGRSIVRFIVYGGKIDGDQYALFEVGERAGNADVVIGGKLIIHFIITE